MSSSNSKIAHKASPSGHVLELVSWMRSDGPYEGVVQQEILRHGLKYRHTRQEAIKDLKPSFTQHIFSNAKDNTLLRSTGWVDDCIVEVYRQHSGSPLCGIAAYATSLERAIQASKEVLKTCVLDTSSQEQDKAAIQFVVKTAGGHSSTQRTMTLPTWDEIKPNYSSTVWPEIEKLIDHRFSEEDGNLILWHGPPGTGKTFAIRALMRAWKHSANFKYIVDPERFFSSSPDYMIDVLLDEESDGGGYYDEDDNWIFQDDGKFKLFILEDAGELLNSNAKNSAGQGLSRLLNLLDGLIGQGLKIKFLITTNEDITTFHPAVIREGRCLSKQEFNPLSVPECNRWFNLHNTDITADRALSLAQLYAALKGYDNNAQPNKVRIGQYM